MFDMSVMTERVLAEVAAFKLGQEHPRTERVAIRLSTDERIELARRAQAEGITLSALVRERVLS